MFEVKFTVVPAQIAVVLALIEIVGVTVGFTVMVSTLLTTLFVARQLAFEVSTHEI